jgi:predicted outer membrane repeat protein
VTLNGALFQNNNASYGGGVYANGDSVLTDTQFINNTTNAGGLQHPIVDRATPAGASGFIAIGAGGGLYANGNAVLNAGLFQSNIAAVAGGGLWATANLIAAGTRFEDNTAQLGSGGGALTSGPATLQNTVFQGNHSPAASGGGVYAASTLNLTRSSFINNGAQRGGGLYHVDGNADVINSLFARNTATVSGTAIYLGSPGTVNLEYLTVGSSNLVLGSAIEVAQGTVNLYDSIVTNHAIGLRNDGGTLIQDYNLFFGVSVQTVGAVSGGSHNATGDPKFVNLAQDNYHLKVGSAAIDQGTDLGIPIDFDGDLRPYGAGFDIGFDEFALRFVYLPLMRR